jgi:acyl-CoA thioester hydrolase
MAVAPFCHQHRVTYADCTLGNHVYYARYLDLLEAARGAFFRELGTSFADWQQREIIFPAVECHLRYQSPARYNEVLNIEVWPTTLHRVRLNFGYRITDSAGKLILQGETWHVCAGLDDRLKRLPAELVARLSPRLPATATGAVIRTKKPRGAGPRVS